MAFEVRYIGNQNNAAPGNIEYNEMDIYNAGLGLERKFHRRVQKGAAQSRGQRRRGTGCDVRLHRRGRHVAAADLPRQLHGHGAANAGDPARYTGTQWTNSATIPVALVPDSSNILRSPRPTAPTGCSAIRRSAAMGWPRYAGELLGDEPGRRVGDAAHGAESTKYHTVQFLVNRRLSNGLALQRAITRIRSSSHSSFDSIFRELRDVRSMGAPPHAFKVTTNYELPIGREKRFGSGISPWLNGIVGDWQVNFTGRVETGRLIDIGDVQAREHDARRPAGAVQVLRQIPVDGFVYNLPQESDRQHDQGVCRRRHEPDRSAALHRVECDDCGGPDPDKPYIAPPSDADCTRIIAGDCGRGSSWSRRRSSAASISSFKKRFPFAGRASFDFQVDVLNVFNAINYNSVFSTSTNPDNYRVTTAYADINNTYDPGGRITQLVFRRELVTIGGQ